MPIQRHERQYAEPISVVFSALARTLAKRRWGVALPGGDAVPVPKVGCRYVSQRGGVLRRGRVIECLRPVGLTLYETLLDAPCRVRLELLWRLEPVAQGSSVRLLVRYRLNGAASLRSRHWARQIEAHCGRMLAGVQSALEGGQRDQGAAAGVNGHNRGSNSIVIAKISAVSGKPIFK